MGKAIKKEEIKEMILNPAYYSKEYFEALKKYNFPVRWMTKNEIKTKEIFVIITTNGEQI